MTKKAKIWLTIGASLLLIGIIIFGGAMKWDFKKLFTTKLETNSYTLTDSFNDISIKTSTADVRFALSDSSNASVVCNEQKNLNHTVSVKDGTLTIELNDTRKWYEHISFGVRNASITVYLPAGEYGALLVKLSTGDTEISKGFSFKSIDVCASTGDIKNCASAKELIKLKASTGDISIENASCNYLDLSVSTGKTTALNVNCKNDISASVSTGKSSFTEITCNSFTSNGNTGDIELNNVVASSSLSINRSTGDVKLNGCDGGEIYITTDTGNVKGSLLSEKVFIVSTDTGKKQVPNTITGGRCEITTDTGDIIISIQ